MLRGTVEDATATGAAGDVKLGHSCGNAEDKQPPIRTQSKLVTESIETRTMTIFIFFFWGFLFRLIRFQNRLFIGRDCRDITSSAVSCVIFIYKRRGGRLLTPEGLQAGLTLKQVVSDG